MATIIPFLRDQVFDQHDINVMSMALDDICRALKLPDGDHPARRVIAERVIDLARTGERNASALRDRLLKEASFGYHLAGSGRITKIKSGRQQSRLSSKIRVE